MTALAFEPIFEAELLTNHLGNEDDPKISFFFFLKCGHLSFMCEDYER